MRRGYYLTLFHSPHVRVLQDLELSDTFRVLPYGERARTFRGETAWMDAERYASDFDLAAWGCTQ
jgi:hypothetical protein